MRRALALLVAALVVAGCGGEDPPAPAVGVQAPESSWVSGQGSLRLAPAYLSIAARADADGARRHAAYERRVKLIAARRLAARKAARSEALRRYREQRARALAKYRAALRKAARERERQRRLAEARRREAERRMRELLRKLRVPPGKECDIPEVARQFDCVSGRLPIRRPKTQRRQ